MHDQSWWFTVGTALDAMWRTRKDAGLPIPRTFDSSVLAALQYYCEESKVFRRRGGQPGEALFRWLVREIAREPPDSLRAARFIAARRHEARSHLFPDDMRQIAPALASR
jgi:hypothetical protein